jgi:hypothetical protein
MEKSRTGDGRARRATRGNPEPANVVIAVLRSSAHAQPQWRNCGGGRRSAQIEEILRRHDIAWIDAFENPPPTRRQLLWTALKLRFTAPAIKMRAQRGLIRYLAGDYLRHQWYFAQRPETRVFLVEECTDYARLRAAREAGVGVVCLPHNLEVWQQTVPRDFYSGEPLPQALHREAQFAALGDVVFCLSREEQWFLTNHGAKTDFLPYFPSVGEVRRLTRIRNSRLEHPPSGYEFFTVTTGANAKNREGVAALAEVIEQLPNDASFHLHVGGHALEELRPRFASKRCTFHGALTDDQLDALMLRCQAAIVFQPAGVGALTRIPELLCAGIPVLANPHAARSAYHLTGVHLFHDPAELLALARRSLEPPPMPSPDTAAEERLVGWIQRLHERGQGTARA